MSWFKTLVRLAIAAGFFSGPLPKFIDQNIYNPLVHKPLPFSKILWSHLVKDLRSPAGRETRSFCTAAGRSTAAGAGDWLATRTPSDIAHTGPVMARPKGVLRPKRPPKTLGEGGEERTRSGLEETVHPVLVVL